MTLWQSYTNPDRFLYNESNESNTYHSTKIEYEEIKMNDVRSPLDKKKLIDFTSFLRWT